MAWIAKRLLVAVGVMIACSACRAGLDEVTYRCSRERRFASDGGAPARGYPYAEGFDDDENDDIIPTLRDRCWQTHDAENADIVESESDLIIRPHGKAKWTKTTRAPSLSQHIDGDFVIVTRAEAVNVSGPEADHCDLGPGEVAGIVVRRDHEPAGWLTLTVRPFAATPTNCVDEPPVPPPNARVDRSGDGLGIAPDAGVTEHKDDVGADGEADIAICRQGDALVTFYRDAKQQWQEVGKYLAIDPGGLEVGLTATNGGSGFVEGHFNWAVFQQIGTLPGDACSGALEAFKEPAEK